MALAELTVSPRTAPPSWVPALGLLPGIGVLPHFDRFGSARTGPLSAVAPPHLAILGIDEDTTILIDATGAATVQGMRTVTLLSDGATTTFASGETLPPGLLRPAAPLT